MFQMHILDDMIEILLLSLCATCLSLIRGNMRLVILVTNISGILLFTSLLYPRTLRSMQFEGEGVTSPYWTYCLLFVSNRLIHYKAWSFSLPWWLQVSICCVLLQFPLYRRLEIWPCCSFSYQSTSCDKCHSCSSCTSSNIKQDGREGLLIHPVEDQLSSLLHRPNWASDLNYHDRTECWMDQSWVPLFSFLCQHRVILEHLLWWMYANFFNCVYERQLLTFIWIKTNSI